MGMYINLSVTEVHIIVQFQRFTTPFISRSRYIRDSASKPLFLSKPNGNQIPSNCRECQGPLTCEIQLLPSLIPALKGNGIKYKDVLSAKRHAHARGIGCADNANDTVPSQLNNVSSAEKPNASSSTNCIEFGTIIIYTCQKSCWPTGPSKNSNNDPVQYCQEQILLQAENI